MMHQKPPINQREMWNGTTHQRFIVACQLSTDQARGAAKFQNYGCADILLILQQRVFASGF